MTITTALNNNTITITTTHTLVADEFFDAIIGSDFYGCTDFVEPNSLTINEKDMSITLSYYDVNNGVNDEGYYNTITETITLEKLVIAYNNLLNDNQTHCGGHSLNYHDYDGCFGYLVLQQACYGTLMF